VAVADAKDPKDPKKDPKDPKGKLRDLDPKTAWQEALAKGTKNPRAIVECADFLIDNHQFAHAVEFLKAALREGIVDQPWAFEALAVSLQMTDASADEVERAIASSVDLQPTDAQAYLKAARSLAELKNHKQALAYCRQAAALQPNDSDSYSSAVAYAHESHDGEAMAWAASRLLAQDWPLENETLHATTQQKLEDLAKLLKAEKRQGESEQMLANVRQSRERDIVIRLTWKGDADLDLKVQEPIGTVCSAQQRQTPGGGTLMGDTLSDTTAETYVAAQAYSGAYEVTVLRAWGRPLGGKAAIEVVRHQGTPQEKIERHVLAIDTTNTLRVMLDDGRRTEAATVPPPSVRQKDDADAPATTSVAAQLRMMTRRSSSATSASAAASAVKRPNRRPRSPRSPSRPPRPPRSPRTKSRRSSPTRWR
jgi:tetratricopeptide (TPR) repeat protein